MIKPTPVTFLASDGITLTGAIYEPSCRHEGVVGLFTPGWSAKYKDYEPILLPLAERYRVVAFNLRGHDGSGGAIDKVKCVDDLCEIDAMYGEPRTAFLGHSLASLTLAAAQRRDPAALILFNPYVNAQLLNPLMRLGIDALGSTYSVSIGQGFDRVLQTLPLKKAGLNMRRPIENTAPLKDIDITAFPPIRQPLLYFIADADRTLGTKNAKRYAAIRSAMAHSSLEAEDASEMVSGLNHCLNTSGLVPFFKEGEGNDQGRKMSRERILTRIYEFLERRFNARVT